MKTTIRIFGLALVLLIANLLIGCNDDDNESVSLTAAAQKITPPPQGPKAQFLVNGATIADIVVTGENIKWYAFSHNSYYLTETTPTETTLRPPKTDSIHPNIPNPPLPRDFILENNKFYYATQTINDIESSEELIVLIRLIENRNVSDQKKHLH